LLAGADDKLLSAYSSYGLPLGDAFQLRDDVLGVFGDPAETGKPAGDDLREGKRTVLIAMALANADAGQAALVQRLLGDPDLSAAGVASLREVIVETKALQQVEELIGSRTAQALAGLARAPVEEGARRVLRDLAEAATTRSV
jgi:geranylgeranyl diphosphate synthase type I